MDLSEFEVNWNRQSDNGNKSLEIQKKQSEAILNQGAQKSSFVEKIRGEQPKHIEIADLPNPVMRGNIPLIRLPKQAVERGKLYCKHCLVGRLDFKKISLSEVKSIALKLWGLEEIWKIIPLGKGFFMVRFANEADLMRIWTGGSWKFGDQFLKLAKWTPDFDPEVQRTTKTLAWVRFPKLGQQFWDYECIMSIAKGVGCPIGVDKFTIEREYGYYANVLIDLDLSKSLPNQILVEVENGEEFLQAVVYPILPNFCPCCQAIGHSKSKCKGLQKEKEKVDPQSNRNTYQEPWRMKRHKNGARRDEENANLRTQQSSDQVNKSGASSSCANDSIRSNPQLMMRENIISTIELHQDLRDHVDVSNTQVQRTHRPLEPLTASSLALTNSFIALEGELDLVPETPDEGTLVSSAERLIGRWSDVEDDASPQLEPAGMVVTDPRIEIQYTKGLGARPKSNMELNQIAVVSTVVPRSSDQPLVLVNSGGIDPSSSTTIPTEKRIMNTIVMQEVSAIKARMAELEAKRKLASDDNSPTSKVKKKLSDSSAPKTRSKTGAKIT